MAEEVLQAYIDNIYSKFGGSIKILSDNGTEFFWCMGNVILPKTPLVDGVSGILYYIIFLILLNFDFEVANVFVLLTDI